MSTRVFLPESTARWISRHLPLADLDRIQFRLCRRLPFSWLVRKRQFVGITFWNRIYLVEENWPLGPPTRANLELIVHELVHVLQYRRNPIWFPLRYVIDHLRFGYGNNPAEVQARETASRVTDSFFV